VAVTNVEELLDEAKNNGVETSNLSSWGKFLKKIQLRPKLALLLTAFGAAGIYYLSMRAPSADSTILALESSDMIAQRALDEALKAIIGIGRFKPVKKSSKKSKNSLKKKRAA
jgi:hypothetical protein